MNMILIRGLPGSGKSTLAKAFEKDGYKHFETDQFFMKDGVYSFNGGQLMEAHAWTRKQVEEAMKDGEDVVISNTFTQHWEMKPYRDLASKHDYNVRVIVCKENYGNIHSIPEASMQRMRERWED